MIARWFSFYFNFDNNKNVFFIYILCTLYYFIFYSQSRNLISVQNHFKRTLRNSKNMCKVIYRKVILWYLYCNSFFIFLFYVYKKKTNCSVSLKLQCNILYIEKQLYDYNCSYTIAKIILKNRVCWNVEWKFWT